jgi:cardiolipin synthase (CMP-forming)
MILNWANRITILRMLLIVPFVSCMLKINDPSIGVHTQIWMRYISLTIFFVMAVSDGIDGYLARSKGQVTRLGAFLDPMADKLLMACACILLVSEKAGVHGFLLPPTVAVLIIGKDMFLLIGFLIVYFTTANIRVVSALIGKISTLLQLSMVIAILIAPEISKFVPLWIWFLRFLWWSAAIAAILATLIYIYRGSRYIDEQEKSQKQQVS